MNNLICNAISSKKCLSVLYNGGNRLIEPYCYGLGTSGNSLLRCYQVSGHSSSGNSHGWKLMKVSEMHNIVITDLEFSVRPLYNATDPAMARFYCRV